MKNFTIVLLICCILILSYFLLTTGNTVYTHIRNPVESHVVSSNWESYVNKYGNVSDNDYVGMNIDDVETLLGRPFVILKQEDFSLLHTTEKTIYVYMPNLTGVEKDRTGIMIYFKESIVVDYIVDEFNGFVIEYIEDYFFF